MENNGKGTGIFYGVIGVATLIITIIGATFAYFSATTNSAEGAVTTGGATITLGYSENIDGIKQNLIPVDPTLEEFNTNFVGIDENKCKDVNGNNICSVYQFTVSNPAGNTVAQRIYGTIVPKTNTFTNLKFAVFKGTAADVDANTATGTVNKTVVADDATNFNSKTQIRLNAAQAIEGYEDTTVGATVAVPYEIDWDVDGTAVTAISTDWENENDANISYTASSADASRKHVIGNKGDLVHTATLVPNGSTTPITIPAFEQVLDVGESMTYTIVMWINETGTAQNEDQTKTFAAGVNFTTEGNGTGVTGVLSATSQ